MAREGRLRPQDVTNCLLLVASVFAVQAVAPAIGGLSSWVLEVLPQAPTVRLILAVLLLPILLPGAAILFGSSYVAESAYSASAGVDALLLGAFITIYGLLHARSTARVLYASQVEEESQRFNLASRLEHSYLESLPPLMRDMVATEADYSPAQKALEFAEALKNFRSRTFNSLFEDWQAVAVVASLIVFVSLTWLKAN